MRKLYFVLIFFVIVLSILVFYIFYSLSSHNKKNVIENPMVNFTSLNNSEKQEKVAVNVDERHITYFLNEVGAYQLHNPPLSSDTPKIEIKVNETTYNAEILNGKIITKKGEIENEDILMLTSHEEIIEAINSGSVSFYIQNSAKDGKTSIEIKASKTLLFFKGYLSLYKEISGESLTGQIINIFE